MSSAKWCPFCLGLNVLIVYVLWVQMLDTISSVLWVDIQASGTWIKGLFHDDGILSQNRICQSRFKIEIKQNDSSRWPYQVSCIFFLHCLQWPPTIATDSCMSKIPLALNCFVETLQWRHNKRDGVSNHQPHEISIYTFINPIVRRCS